MPTVFPSFLCKLALGSIISGKKLLELEVVGLMGLKDLAHVLKGGKDASRQGMMSRGLESR